MTKGQPELGRRNRARSRRNALPAGFHAAAEVLELRQVLTANVTAVVSGTTLTLTGDNHGDHEIDIARADAGHVEVAAFTGTVNGLMSVLLPMSSVSKITINLGNGSDMYLVGSLAGEPALNIGSGGITFQGASGVLDQLELINSSSNQMTIQGNVTVQGLTPGSPLMQSATAAMEAMHFGAFEIGDDGTGGLTINGNVSSMLEDTGGGILANGIDQDSSGTLAIGGSVNASVILKGSSATSQSGNAITDSGTGNLIINGDVNLTASTNNQSIEDGINTDESGKISINGNLTETSNSTTGACENFVATQAGASGGSILIGKSVSQTAQSKGSTGNSLQANDGDIVINNSLSQYSGGPYGTASENSVASNKKGTITIGLGGGGVTQEGAGSVSAFNSFGLTGTGNINVQGTLEQDHLGYGLSNDIFDNGAGNLAISKQIKESDYAGSGTVDNQVHDSGTGNLTVGSQGVMIATELLGTSTTTESVVNNVFASSSGHLTCNGLISETTTNTSEAAGTAIDKFYTSGSSAGALFVQGIAINNSGKLNQQNLLTAGGAALSVGAEGITINGSGKGSSSDDFTTQSVNSPIFVSGNVSITEPGNGTSVLNITAGHTNSYITILGNVSYDNHLNHTDTSTATIYGSTDVKNSAVVIFGSLLVQLASSPGNASDSSPVSGVSLGANGDVDSNGDGTFIHGITSITGTTGPDAVYWTYSNLAGPVVIDFKGTSDLLVDGAEEGSSCQFIGITFGSNVTVTMSDAHAMLGIDQLADSFASQITFGGVFTANVNGPNSTVSIAPWNFDLSYQLVTFDAAANFNGKPNSGDVLTYDPAHISGTISSKNMKRVVI